MNLLPSVTLVRTRSTSPTFRVAIGVGFALVAAVVAPATARRDGAAWTRWSASALQTPPPSHHPAFRLGDAARPFGWSTAIADFNTDGEPDLAIADRIATGAGQRGFRVEFSISGQEPHDITFESSRDAVTITVADVDRDSDLDVIVGTPLSGETVGIWLNDGHGRFTAGPIQQAPSTVRPVASLDAADSETDVAAFEPSPRRAHDVLPAVFRSPPARSVHEPVNRPSARPRSESPASSARPRAPPHTA